MIISIDGPAASGKGTIAQRLASHFNFAHLDSGLFYRAYPELAMQLTGNLDNDVKMFIEVFNTLDPAILRKESQGQKAAQFASNPQVRALVTTAIRHQAVELALESGGAIVDGRDIGTVVFPDADVKLFITASVQSRARRRWLEMVEKKLDHEEEIPLSEIEKDVVARDARDINRKDAPLRAADDAFVIDTTAFDKEQAFEMVLEAVESALKGS